MDAEDSVTIGQRLRRIRLARDKTQKVIADRAGISDAHWPRSTTTDRVGWCSRWKYWPTG